VSSLIGYGRQLAQRARDLSPLAVDATIALACFLTIAIVTVVDDRAAWRTDWWIFGLGALNALPLLWRRRYPLTVTAAVGAVTTWLALAQALGNVPVAQLVATYTFAALCPPLRRLIGVLGTVVGITVSIVVPGDDVLSFGPAGIMFVVAYALGTSARARRDRIAMLEERARRHAEERDAAATRERERIAREMHDILAHSMSLLVVQAEAGPVAVRSDPAKAAAMFDSISSTARDALAQLRRTLGVLRSEDAARHPQPDLTALPSLVESVRDAGVDGTLEEHGQPRPVPPALAATAYRIVQESLTNTVRHAAANRVRVGLTWREHALEVEVRDDGRGPTADRTEGGGHGLVGMRERVAVVGGELSTGAGPDGVGFRVAATLPLQ
jgi:signal transduction histidine kinase